MQTIFGLQVYVLATLRLHMMHSTASHKHLTLLPVSPSSLSACPEWACKMRFLWLFTPFNHPRGHWIQRNHIWRGGGGRDGLRFKWITLGFPTVAIHTYVNVSREDSRFICKATRSSPEPGDGWTIPSSLFKFKWNLTPNEWVTPQRRDNLTLGSSVLSAPVLVCLPFSSHDDW